MIWLLACAEPLPPPPPLPEPACALTYQALVETETPIGQRYSEATRTLVEFVATGEQVAPSWRVAARVDDGLAVPQPEGAPLPAPLPTDSSQWTGDVWPHLALLMDPTQTHVTSPQGLLTVPADVLIPMERTERVVDTAGWEGRDAAHSEALWRGATRQPQGAGFERVGVTGKAQVWREGSRLLLAHAKQTVSVQRGADHRSHTDVTVGVWLIADCEGPVLDPPTVWSPTERMLQRWNVLERAVQEGDWATARQQAARVFSSGVLQAHGTDAVLEGVAAFQQVVPVHLLERAWVVPMRAPDPLDHWSLTTVSGGHGLVRTRLHVHPVSGAIWSMTAHRESDPALNHAPATLHIDADQLRVTLPPSPDP